MASSHDQNLHLLAEKIGRLFEKGLEVDDALIHYMDSTFSNHDIRTLEAVIQDPSDCERDSLIELLYFPSETVQVLFEDFLEAAALTAADEHAILSLLPAHVGKTCFHFADPKSIWRIDTPVFGAVAFLHRLNISKNPEKCLADTIQRVVPASDQNRCKVIIRNAPFAMTSSKADYLTAFFLQSDARDNGFMKRFRFVMRFFSEWNESINLFAALAARKRLLISQLHQAAKLDDLHKNRNIETLMMMGVRSPHMDRQDMAEKITMIDDIGLAIFGKTVYEENFSPLPIGRS